MVVIDSPELAGQITGEMQQLRSNRSLQLNPEGTYNPNPKVREVKSTLIKRIAVHLTGALTYFFQHML